MLAHIIVISEWLTFVMQLYNSFVRPGNLSLEMISGTSRLFCSVPVQRPARRSPRLGPRGAAGAAERAEQDPASQDKAAPKRRATQDGGSSLPAPERAQRHIRPCAVW